MSFNITKCSDILSFNERLNDAFQYISTNSKLRKIEPNQSNTFDCVNELLKNNWTYLIDKNQDTAATREKIFENLDKIARELYLRNPQSDNVRKLVKKISRCIDVFAPHLSILTTRQNAIFPSEIVRKILYKLPETPLEITTSLKTLKDLRISFPELANEVLAHFININHIPLYKVIDRCLEEIYDLSPLLVYVNLTKIPVEDDQLASFTFQCTHLQSLKINSSFLTKLPTYPHLSAHLKELNVNFCSALRSLPDNYLNLQNFYYKNTPLVPSELLKLPINCKKINDLG